MDRLNPSREGHLTFERSCHGPRVIWDTLCVTYLLIQKSYRPYSIQNDLPSLIKLDRENLKPRVKEESITIEGKDPSQF